MADFALDITRDVCPLTFVKTKLLLERMAPGDTAEIRLIGQEPRIASHRQAMGDRLARALGVEPECVGVRATTTDFLGFTGRGEGLAAQAVALLERVESR